MRIKGVNACKAHRTVIDTQEATPGWLSGKESTCQRRVRSLGREDALEKEITHRSLLAWESPWTAEPGEQQSMGPQRAGLDSVIKQ